MSNYRALHREETSTPLWCTAFGLPSPTPSSPTSESYTILAGGITGTLTHHLITPKSIEKADTSAAALTISALATSSPSPTSAITAVHPVTPTTALTLSLSGIVHLHDLTPGEVTATVLLEDATTLSLSANKTTVLGATKTPELVVFEVGNPTATTTIMLDFESISTAISPSGSCCATGNADGSIIGYKVSNPYSPCYTIKGPYKMPYPIRALTYTPNESLLIAGSDDARIYVYDHVEGGVLRAVMAGHTGWITGLVAHVDGARIVSCSADETVKVWDLASKQSLHTFDGGHEKSVMGVDFGEVVGGKRRIVSVCDGGNLVISSSD